MSPNTLRTWERKFGYPKPLRTPGRHRAYTYAEIVALRDALARGLSVPSAISAVREGLGADSEALVNALSSFDTAGADRAMEASLALRSMERSVEEVLLPALDEVRRRDGAVSATWAFAQHWGVEWLGRAQRLSPLPAPFDGLLIGDASSGALSVAQPRVRALELFCRRRSIDVLVIPVEVGACLTEMMSSLEPACVVVAGFETAEDRVARWVYAVRALAGPIPVARYLSPARTGGDGGSGSDLSAVPLQAQHQLVELLARGKRAKRAGSIAEANDLAQQA